MKLPGIVDKFIAMNEIASPENSKVTKKFRCSNNIEKKIHNYMLEHELKKYVSCIL